MGERVGCVAEAGSSFTVAGTIDNVIHFWGTRNISPVTRPNTQDAFGANFQGSANSTAGEEHRQDLDTEVIFGFSIARNDLWHFHHLLVIVVVSR